MRDRLGLGPRERVASGLLSGALVAGLGWALIAGLGVSLPRAAEEALAAFDVVPLPPPPEERVVPPPARSKRPEERAAPPNIRSKATQVVAPVPVVPPPVPSPVVAAPVAHVGNQATAGAADRVGPGTGAGGQGDGFGGGGDGDGDGGGYDGELSPPRWRSGRLSNAVLPEMLRDREGLYAVELRFSVETDGRLTGCRVMESSGWPDLDRNACRAMELRMRYEPAREPDGRPVRVKLITRQEWQVD